MARTHRPNVLPCWWQPNWHTKPELFSVYIYSIQCFFVFILLPTATKCSTFYVWNLKTINGMANWHRHTERETECLSDRKWVFRHYFPFWDLNQSSRPIQLNIFFSLHFLVSWFSGKSLVTFFDSSSSVATMWNIRSEIVTKIDFTS